MANNNTPAQSHSGSDETAALKARIAQLEAALTAKSKITYKVSEKGAVSAYGMGKFPVTLYVEQWERLDRDAENRKAFIASVSSQLKRKPVA